MHIAFGTDETTETSEAVVEWLESAGHTVIRAVDDGTAWPEVGRGVATLVASGAVDRGVVCCWTGTGVSIAANKVPAVRAALCVDASTAAGARRWNDANVVALGLASTTPSGAVEILDAFLTTAVADDELAAIARVEDGVAPLE